MSSAALAWLIWLLTLGCWVGALYARVAYGVALGPTTQEPGGVVEAVYSALVAASFLGIATVGLLVALRRPESYFGWLISVCLLLVAAPVAFNAYAQVATRVAGGGPADSAVIAAWLATWVGIANLGLLGPILVLFPTGRALSRRWHAVMWLVGAASVVTAAAVAFRPGQLRGIAAYVIDNPLGIIGGQGVLDTVQQVGLVCLSLGMLAGASSLVVRLLRARGSERQQVKWVAYGAVIWSLGLSLNVLGPLEWRPLTSFAYMLTLNAWTITIGLAILNHRLYDIDLVISRTLVYGALAVCITVIYIAGVTGVGALIGSRGEPGADLLLSLLATALVALLFQPLRTRVERLANRLVYGHRASPYEVLAEFSRGLASAPSLDKVLPRMAEAAARGVGATRSRVRVYVPGGGDKVAAWPPGSLAQPLDRTVLVVHQATPVGEIGVAKPHGELLTHTERTLLEDLAAQAGPALATLRLTLDLRASRQRLVTAQDAERRRLERDIHDGAQQNLVALAVQLRLARQLMGKDPSRAGSLFDELDRQAKDALGTLRELARGIYPPMLADRGLVGALKAHVLRACPDARLEADALLASARFAPQVEAAVYFCCLEALQNTTKHAADAPVAVQLSELDGWLTFSVSDDGPGFETSKTSSNAGTGLQSMADRLAALDGLLEITSVLGHGTTVRGRVPIPRASIDQEAPPVAAQAEASRSGAKSAFAR